MQLQLATQTELKKIVEGDGTTKYPGLQNQPYAIWAPFYEALYQALTVQTIFYGPDGSYVGTSEEPAAGVDRAVWVWIKGAISVNSGTGALGQYIRDYTSAQYQERTGNALAQGPSAGGSITPLQKASNNIALNVYNQIKSNGWTVPSLQKIGENDASGAAAAVFTGVASSTGSDNSSPWAGTVSFTDLGDDSFFTKWVLTNGTNSGKQETGTYDLVSIAAAIAQVKTPGLIASILADGQFGLALETQTLGAAATADAIAKTHTFFTNTYGSDVSSIDIEDPIFSLRTSLITPSDQFRVGTLQGQSLNVKASNQIVVGGPGDDSFVAPDAPGSSSAIYYTRVLDGGAGQNRITYSTYANLKATLQGVQHDSSDPTMTGAPKWRLQVLDPNNPDASDSNYNFQKINLGAGDDSVSFGPDLKASDLSTSSGDAIEIDGGKGNNTLDLSGLMGGLKLLGSKLGVLGADFSNFDILKGSSKGDYIKGNNEIKEYDLGNGNNYIADVSGSVLPQDQGKQGSNWVRIDLGSGTSTVGGGIAAGSDIYADAGHVGDQIEVSPDTRLHGLNPTDKVTWAGEVLTGGVRNADSDDPWAHGLGGFIRYGINAIGDLVIQTVASLIESKLSPGAADPSTYVAGYINGDASGSANATAGIYTIQTSLKFYLLRDHPDLPPGWLLSTWSINLGNVAKALTGHSLWAGVDPLVLDLGGKGIATSALETNATERFDINGDGFANPSGWVGPDQGFLVHVNSDGETVTSAKQLFGSGVVDGFQQLAASDVNGDGRIDASDPGWVNLRIWQDTNGNHQQDGPVTAKLCVLAIWPDDYSPSASIAGFS